MRDQIKIVVAVVQIARTWCTIVNSKIEVTEHGTVVDFIAVVDRQKIVVLGVLPQIDILLLVVGLVALAVLKAVEILQALVEVDLIVGDDLEIPLVLVVGVEHRRLLEVILRRFLHPVGQLVDFRPLHVLVLGGRN